MVYFIYKHIMYYIHSIICKIYYISHHIIVKNSSYLERGISVRLHKAVTRRTSRVYRAESRGLSYNRMQLRKTRAGCSGVQRGRRVRLSLTVRNAASTTLSLAILIPTYYTFPRCYCCIMTRVTVV